MFHPVYVKPVFGVGALGRDEGSLGEGNGPRIEGFVVQVQMGEVASGFGELFEGVGVGDGGDARQFAGESCSCSARDRRVRGGWRRCSGTGLQAVMFWMTEQLFAEMDSGLGQRWRSVGRSCGGRIVASPRKGFGQWGGAFSYR